MIQRAINPATYQAALSLAQTEQKLLGQVIEPFLAYAVSHPTDKMYLIYTVQRGDSLGTIAQKFYNNAGQYSLIQQANNIANPGYIWIGLLLAIPPATHRTTKNATVDTPILHPDIDNELVAALKLADEWQQAGELSALGPYLSRAGILTALAAAKKMDDDWAQSKSLAVLTVRLAELGHGAKALTTARHISRGWNKATALLQMAPYLPHIFHTEALSIARTIRRPEDRSAAFVGLAIYLNDPFKMEALDEAVAAVEAIDNGPLQQEAKAELTARLAELGYQPSLIVSEPNPESAETQIIVTPLPQSQVVLPKQSVATKKPRWLTFKLKPVWLFLFVVIGLAGLFVGGVGGVFYTNQHWPLESIDIPSNGTSMISKTSLERGKFYSVVVSGLFNYNVDRSESWADAQTSFYLNKKNWITTYWLSINAQKVIAQLEDLEEHQYIFYVQGNDRPIKLRIEEHRATDYLNNGGELEVAIYVGLLEWNDIK